MSKLQPVVTRSKTPSGRGNVRRTLHTVKTKYGNNNGTKILGKRDTSKKQNKKTGVGVRTHAAYRRTKPDLLCEGPSLYCMHQFFHLTYSRWTSSLLSCLWSLRIFPSLPGSRLTIFLSRCKFSTLTTRQPMVEFYLLTFPRFPLRKKEHKSYFSKNRTHDFRTSRCAAYLLDHSGDERLHAQGKCPESVSHYLI